MDLYVIPGIYSGASHMAKVPILPADYWKALLVMLGILVVMVVVAELYQRGRKK